jgi:hypothetical protein
MPEAGGEGRHPGAVMASVKMINPHDNPEDVLAAIQWGQTQATRAPRWSPDKRRRMAVLLGWVLPEADTSPSIERQPDTQS